MTPMTSDATLAPRLRADIERSGYYPELVSDTLDTALADEAVVSYVVHHEATFDHDELRRHVTVLALTPTRLIVGHTDEHPPDETSTTSYATASTEAVRLERIDSVVVTRVAADAAKHRRGAPVKEVVLTIGWGAVSRIDLEPASCGDPRDHDRVDALDAHRLGGRGRVRGRGGLVGRVLVGVPDDEPGRREREDGDVATQLVVVEGGLVVHDVGQHRLARERGVERVAHQLGVVAAALDVGPEPRCQGGVAGHARHPRTSAASGTLRPSSSSDTRCRSEASTAPATSATTTGVRPQTTPRPAPMTIPANAGPRAPDTFGRRS